jgi:malyl-CoA/(S)-citramalyl-CoA lyase
MNRAEKNGEGVTVFKGRMVDIASIKQAEVLVKLADLIKSD